MPIVKLVDEKNTSMAKTTDNMERNSFINLFKYTVLLGAGFTFYMKTFTELGYFSSKSRFLAHKGHKSNGKKVKQALNTRSVAARGINAIPFKSRDHRVACVYFIRPFVIRAGCAKDFRRTKLIDMNARITS